MQLTKKFISSTLFNLVSGVSLVFLLSSHAALAKTPSYKIYKDNPVFTPIATWTGFYVGAGAGMGSWTADSHLTVGGTALTAGIRTGGFGGFGMLSAGYDYEFNHSIVAGAFIDGNLGHLSGNLEFPGVVGNIAETGTWGVGARLGALINPTSMPYLTLGFSRTYFNSTNLYFALPGGVSSGLTTPSFGSSGWFAGAGLEVLFGAHFSLKGEYRYANYNTRTLAINGAPGALLVTGVGMPFHPVNQTAQAELAYKFG
jgi:outer membrane immunogenic protein